jgi:hypothetical protein
MPGVMIALVELAPAPRVMVADEDDTPRGTWIEHPAHPCACPMDIPETLGTFGFGTRMTVGAGTEKLPPIVHRQ